MNSKNDNILCQKNEESPDIGQLYSVVDKSSDISEMYSVVNNKSNKVRKEMHQLNHKRRMPCMLWLIKVKNRRESPKNQTTQIYAVINKSKKNIQYQEHECTTIYLIFQHTSNSILCFLCFLMSHDYIKMPKKLL